MAVLLRSLSLNLSWKVRFTRRSGTFSGTFVRSCGRRCACLEQERPTTGQRTSSLKMMMMLLGHFIKSQSVRHPQGTASSNARNDEVDVVIDLHNIIKCDILLRLTAYVSNLFKNRNAILVRGWKLRFQCNEIRFIPQTGQKHLSVSRLSSPECSPQTSPRLVPRSQTASP